MNNLNYGIIGNGRMAKHFAHYLSLLNIPYQTWCRGQPTQSLNILAKQCEPILILIDDDAIVPFIEQHGFLTEKLLVHFSGNLYTTSAYGAHPLLSFSEQLYPLKTYQKIPFIYEQGAPPFAKLLPGLTNPHFTISPQLKSFYHALCVLSGNFTVILWQKFFSELENTLQIPKEQAYPYLEQIMQNLITDPKKALTGPLVRQDQKTIASHLQSLENDPFQDIYRAFLHCSQLTDKNL